MHKCIWSVRAVAIICFASPATSFAAPIGLHTTAATSVCSAEGRSHASCSGQFITIIDFDPNFPFMHNSRQDANATASFGELHAYVNETHEEGSIPWVAVELRATSAFTDQLTVSGGAGDGFIQYLFSGQLEGGATEVGDPFLSGFYFQHDGSPPQGASVLGFNPYVFPDNYLLGGPFTYASPLMPFAWGTSFDLHVLAQARVFLAGGDAMAGPTVVDLALEGVNVYNANGQRVNASISSAAGADYAVTAIPEPATLLLVGAGVVGSLYRKSRRRHCRSDGLRRRRPRRQ